MTTKVFPIKPERVCTGNYTDGHGRYCAIGWFRKFDISTSIFTKNYSKIFKKETGKSDDNIVFMNDRTLKNRQDRAALINATLKSLGYDIPLAATVGKTILKKGYRKN